MVAAARRAIHLLYSPGIIYGLNQLPRESTPSVKETSSHPPFFLKKWYLDCIDDAGDAAILYCAETRWCGLHLNYCSIVSMVGEVATSRTSLRCFHIYEGDREIGVKLPGLKVIGKWNAGSAPVQQTVYENSTGYVHWNCIQPRSFARIRIGDRELVGLGYVECLTLTLEPWQLPMRELRWGRFVSPRDALVWIDWQGPYSTSFAFHNERKLDIHGVSESELVAGGATLRMKDSTPIRLGRLRETVLPGAPALGRIFPHSIFNVEECKWRSRGVLDVGDRRAEGWVIHEVVRWNI